MSSSPKKSEASTAQKTVLSLPHGRMVVLEDMDEDGSDLPTLVDMARAGQGEGYVRYNETARTTVGSDSVPGVILRILIRPAMHASHAGKLAAFTAVAVARAIERHSDMQVRIHWVNDLYEGKRKLGAILTNAQIDTSGHFDYAVIRIALSLDPADFPPRLGDVIRRVFRNEATLLSVRLVESIVEEFFTLYDDVSLHPVYMEEYRKRSATLGRRVKVLTGTKYERGLVTDIDENACLVVRLSRKRSVTVRSRSEIVL